MIGTKLLEQGWTHSFGVAGAVSDIRGDGKLTLTEESLLFQDFLTAKRVVIDLKTVRLLDVERRLIEKGRKRGKEAWALRVEFEASKAFTVAVNEPAKWVSAVEAQARKRGATPEVKNRGPAGNAPSGGKRIAIAALALLAILAVVYFVTR
jgi:hypothetical protein